MRFKPYKIISVITYRFKPYKIINVVTYCFHKRINCISSCFNNCKFK